SASVDGRDVSAVHDGRGTRGGEAPGAEPGGGAAVRGNPRGATPPGDPRAEAHAGGGAHRGAGGIARLAGRDRRAGGDDRRASQPISERGLDSAGEGGPARSHRAGDHRAEGVRLPEVAEHDCLSSVPEHLLITIEGTPNATVRAVRDRAVEPR